MSYTELILTPNDARCAMPLATCRANIVRSLALGCIKLDDLDSILIMLLGRHFRRYDNMLPRWTYSMMMYSGSVGIRLDKHITKQLIYKLEGNKTCTFNLSENTLPKEKKLLKCL